MAIIDVEKAPRFQRGGMHVTGFASPSRGAHETNVWQMTLDPKTPGAVHRLTREEVLVAVEGTASLTIGGVPHELKAGGAAIVPPDTDFSISNDTEAPFRAVVAFPVGGKAVLGGQILTPPWAE